jgi:hypothetical protein
MVSWRERKEALAERCGDFKQRDISLPCKRKMSFLPEVPIALAPYGVPVG